MGEQSGDLVDPTAFEVGKHQVDQAVVLTVSGEVDMLSSPLLADAIQTALATKPAALIVDLSKVGFLASAGMTVLVTAQAESEVGGSNSRMGRCPVQLLRWPSRNRDYVSAPGIVQRFERGGPRVLPLPKHL